MDDFIFGTLHNDELKLINEHSIYEGIQHQHRRFPLRPSPDQEIQLLVRIGPDLDIDHLAAYFTVDGSVPDGSKGAAINGQSISFERVSQDWTNFKWGYAENWIGRIPGQPNGTLLRYCIGGWKDGGMEHWADSPETKFKMDMAAANFFSDKEIRDSQIDWPQRKRIFAMHVSDISAPAWAQEAIIYHIFADRFFPGKNRPWKDAKSLQEFQGGTLYGVRDKLAYLKNLGINTIWLSPTWPSPSYHRYDITNYFEVADELGGQAAMQALMKEARQMGIRVVIDLVCNHLSNLHPHFTHAQNNKDSEFRNYFKFANGSKEYRSFFGYPGMPEINLQDEAAKNWMIAIAKYWIEEYDIDGFRLDHANGPGPAFWAEFSKACKAIKPDIFCFGEVVESPDQYLAYSGQLDGLLDFGLSERLRKWAKGESRGMETVEQFARRHFQFFKDSSLLMPTFLDNHDMDRFLYIAKGDQERLMRAAGFQFKLPGPPIIYYGTEIGMTQSSHPTQGDDLVGSRAPMEWNENEQHDLFHFYRDLIINRKKQHS